MGIDFSAFEHRQDPRVLVVPLEFQHVFEEVATTGRYQAAILQKTPDAKHSLRRKFSRVVANLGSAASASKILKAHATLTGHVELEFDPDLMLVNDELQSMADAFHRMTSIRDILVYTVTDFSYSQIHSHEYPVLTCSWPEGTVWPNPEGDLLKADEAGWFYIGPGFDHASPTLVSKDTRTSIFIKPDF